MLASALAARAFSFENAANGRYRINSPHFSNPTFFPLAKSATTLQEVRSLAEKVPVLIMIQGHEPGARWHL
jgi:hypothetical protein